MSRRPASGKNNVFSLLKSNEIKKLGRWGKFVPEDSRFGAGTNFRPLMSSLVTLLWLAGCAAPADRTRQLLELDLANRQGTIESLDRQFSARPEAWQAYSLGILYGADGDYKEMNTWFERCRTMTAEHDGDINFARMGHWRDEARAGDEAAAQGQWAEAMTRFEKALLAVPGKKETVERYYEARTLAFGPGLDEIRNLVALEHPEAIYRWLEMVAQEDMAHHRLGIRVRLSSRMNEVAPAPGDDLAHQKAYDLAHLVCGELARMDRDWLGMDRSFQQIGTGEEASRPLRRQITESRQASATTLLQEALVLWSEENVSAALAKLDTADVVDPDRADVVTARQNIHNLQGARNSAQVAEVLAMGDLDSAWLTVWMHRLHRQGRIQGAGLVADRLLSHPDPLTTDQKSQALRVRVAWSRRQGHLDRACEDLRTLLDDGTPQPEVALLLGDILLAQCHYEEAGLRFEQARRWGLDTVGVSTRLAGVAFSQNDFPAMAAWAASALELDPENEEALALRDRARLLGGEVAP